MLERSIALQKGMAGLDAKDCLAKLDEAWPGEGVRQKHVEAAYRAAGAFGDVDKLMAKYGNDPDFIQFAAKVGAELKEDTSAGAGASGDKTTEMEIQALAASPAYFNAADPQHAIVKARVTAFYDKKYGTGPKSSGSVSIGQIG